jgi:hypothetical protein
MPTTFPSPFPAHQGLILPLARRWPGYFDVIALFVGAAIPDLVDITFGFLINGYFKQWFGHALIGIPINIFSGLLLTWLVKAFIVYMPKNKTTVSQNPKAKWQIELGVWSFSLTIGLLSHLGLDLISHNTNLLLYPWHENLRWFPEWWYATWFIIQPPPWLGPLYSVGIHTVFWIIFSTTGTFLFYQFLFQQIKARNLSKVSLYKDMKDL